MLDEPFSGLDPLVRDELVEGILAISADPRWTVFVSSHDLAEIENLVTHVAYIDRGRLEFRFSEELASLQDCFREVEVTCDEPVQVPSPWPEEWLKPQTSSAVVRFVVTDYPEDKTPQRGQGDVSHLPRPVNTAYVRDHLHQSGESASSSRKHGGPMNQIVHIFRKDCRLWPMIFAVLLFTFLHGYGDVTNFGGGVTLGLSHTPCSTFWGDLVVSVIQEQEESLVGTDKFWLTRPSVSPHRSSGVDEVPACLTSGAFRDYQSDVVSLFMRVESSNLICNRYQQLRRG